MRLRLIFTILLGLIFFVFGLNGFLNFIKVPPMTGGAADFLSAMIHTGYLFPLLKGTEVACGFLLLTGMFVPLALVVLAPISINIVLFHAFLAPEGLPVAVGVVALHLIVAFFYRAHFASVLKARV